jgi:hypothetical protein
MAKGLKQMVAEAEAAADETEELLPVFVNGDAQAALSHLVRQWTGHDDTVLHFGDPRLIGAPSPWACFDLANHNMWANVDALLLNPNRVLLTVTPFRLRQEAVLTGALLHEAAHARHSKWFLEAAPIEKKGKPVYLHTPRQGALKKSERVATKETVALAKLIEEPRIEGLMAKECNSIGALGLAWTMRAMATALMPPTILHGSDDQVLMDIISSWVLRAGRQYAMSYHQASYNLADWTLQFNDLLTSALDQHFIMVGTDHIAPNVPTKKAANTVLDMLVAAVQADAGADTGPGQIDRARDILDVLFPETQGGAGKPTPSGGCTADPGDPGESGDSEPDTGNESDEQGEGGGESEDEDYEPGTGDEDLDAMLKEMMGEDSEVSDIMREAMIEALASMEEQADDAVEYEAATRQAETPPPDNKAAKAAGVGYAPIQLGRGFRNPTPEEREVKNNASKFLRQVITPSTAQRVTLTEAPSTSIDPAELAAWRAGGQIRDPRFFRRTIRTEQPAPPVKVGVSVDVSISMEELAYPSALLSYALAGGAVDLRNYAGRGVQVESCLVHWGSRARVIQHNGDPMPGLYEHACDQTTSAMADAHDLIEQEIPGFHEVSGNRENRLLVNFTDWIIGNWSTCIDPLGKAMSAGVNVISVVPEKWNVRNSMLDDTLAAVRAKYGITPGTHTVLRFDPAKPEEVWSVAQGLLR